MNITEIVYKNRDNPNVVSFSEDNALMDLSSVTRVELKLYKNLAVRHTEDSSSSPSLMTWTADKITFNLNDVALADGTYAASVTVYDTNHPDGQVIAHPQSQVDRLFFRFVNA